MTTSSSHGERIAAVFDLAASGYDNAALRFFPVAAERLLSRLALRPGEQLLDIATGTGVVAFGAAQRVGPSGRVFGIDLSRNMLARAEARCRQFGLANVDLRRMDATVLDFHNDVFHVVTSSFGLFFMPDMAAALSEWRRVLQPGGRIGFTAFSANAFQPQMKMFFERLARHGVEVDEKNSAARRLMDPSVCVQILNEAGFEGAEVMTRQQGYYLSDAEDWWRIVMGAAFRGHVERLAPDAREAFRKAHLEEIGKLAGADGIWLDVEVHFVTARRPA